MSVKVIASETPAEIVSEAPITEPQTETVEAVADASVDIAQIEAARDVEIAEIHAEVEGERMAAASTEKEQMEWRRNIEIRLETVMQENSELRSILALLTKPEPSPPNPPEPVEESGEVMPAKVEEPPPEPAKRRKPRFRLI